jgi:hypothetical protein
METERYCRSRVYVVYSNYSIRGYRKEMSREIDRVRSSWDTLGERGGEASSLQIRCRSVFSTPWSTQSLTLTRFGWRDFKIALGRGERERGERRERMVDWSTW